MSDSTTVLALLSVGAGADAALLAPERPVITYESLRQHIGDVAHQLNGLGVGRGDSVAIVLPNGPELAVSLLAVTVAATAAPLNPAYTADELAFYFDDLSVVALIVAAGDEGVAREVARARGIRILDLLVPPGAAAGKFELRGTAGPTVEHGGFAQADDIALVLHTSGTTARPKIVPLTQRNLAVAAGNVGVSLGLGPEDRCLNIMPLFHIHGMISGVLASLAAGGSVYCSPGFNALRFFTWLEESQATWYTGVPPMHQVIAGRAARNPEPIARSRLRFMRSASSALSVNVLAELEHAFGVPVIEAYGMTEATHQIASNPLPPKPRKPGTVGIAAGCDIAILNESGRHLSVSEIGEIAIQGEGVMGAYLDNPAANASAFVAGWFRTGDQGVMDAQGYLTITGRLKEIINRGGEKISPKEIDDVLYEHPTVAQAVTFALPHDKLGEEVAAAVVFKHRMSTTEQELKDFAAARLAPFKVPRLIVFCDHLPRGPTGKVQRISMAEQLGLRKPDQAAP